MQILSKIVNIPYTSELTTEYVEEELQKYGITPLRWAIVKVDNNSYTINCAYSCD